jgi:hypothetical protein
MEKIYKYENATIHVTSNKSCDQKTLKKATEEFVKNVIRGGNSNGYTNKTGNFNKK